MFGQVFSFFTRRERARRARLADTLLRRLDSDNYLAVDRPLLRDLGTSRRELFRVVYGLVVKERMYMLSEAGGTVILMTNAEYSRFMARRSTAYGPGDSGALSAVAAGRTPEASAGAFAGDDLDETWIAARQERLDGVAASILVCDSESALFTGATLGGATLDGLLAAEAEAETSANATVSPGASTDEAEPDYGWFDLDVAAGEKVPEKRQSLPKRRRQPWLVAEPAGLDAE